MKIELVFKKWLTFFWLLSVVFTVQGAIQREDARPLLGVALSTLVVLYTWCWDPYKAWVKRRRDERRDPNNWSV